jgi:hypothetical protein
VAVNRHFLDYKSINATRIAGKAGFFKSAEMKRAAGHPAAHLKPFIER